MGKYIYAPNMELYMKYVEPMRVNGIWAMSKTIQEEDFIERRFFLGFFVNTIPVDHIQKAISDAKLELKIFTSGGTGNIMCIPSRIHHGVIFETVSEFTNNLKNNVTYDDINDIYKGMHQWKS